jgi:hypothetical protein
MRRLNRLHGRAGVLQWPPFLSSGTASSSAPTVGAQRFRGGGGRPVFGLWAAYSIAASHLDRDSALACAVRRFVPITAAGQRRNHTGFPFKQGSESPCTCTGLVYRKVRRKGVPVLGGALVRLCCSAFHDLPYTGVYATVERRQYAKNRESLHE